MSARTPSGFVQVPGRLDQIAVGRLVDSATGNGVWGLAGSQPYRFNFTSNVFDPVPGRLTSISVRDWNAVWGLNGTDIFRWDVLSNTFKQVPGQLTSIVGWDMAENNVWGLLGSDPGFRGTQSGGIFRFDIGSNSFKPVPGQQLSSIYVGGGSPDFHPAQVWGLNFGEIFHWDWDSNNFVQVLQQEGVGEAALQVLSVGYSEVWGLVNGLVFRFNFTSNVFEHLSGTLTDISVMDENTVWGLSGAWNQDSDIFWFDPDLKNWKQIPGKLASLSVGNSSVGISENINYEVWGRNANGDVFRSVTFVGGPTT